MSWAIPPAHALRDAGAVLCTPVGPSGNISYDARSVECVALPAWLAVTQAHLLSATRAPLVGAAITLVVIGAALYLLIRNGLLTALRDMLTCMFKPARVKIVHNPLVRRPLEVLCESVDLAQVAAADPLIAEVAACLGFGLGIKGGIARKILKILYGTPEPASNDFDVDIVVLAERGLTPAEQTELRKTVAGMQMGHLILEPKDVEVISKEELKIYWVTRDVCLNEVLLMRLAPGAPLTLFYSRDARHDARHNVVRCIPRALKSDFAECWALDGATPILTPKLVARTMLRYFKGGAQTYEFDEASWAYYRRTKLQPITLFQILRNVHGDDAKYKEVVTHLIEVGLLSPTAVRERGGFNGLWGATLAEVNEKMAVFGGRLSLDEPDAEAVERWIVTKKAQMRMVPYHHRERASRTGFIPADEDALTLGLVTFAPQLLEYIEREGGLWDPAHPSGLPDTSPPCAASWSEPTRHAGAHGSASVLSDDDEHPGGLVWIPPERMPTGPAAWLSTLRKALGRQSASPDSSLQQPSSLAEPLLHVVPPSLQERGSPVRQPGSVAVAPPRFIRARSIVQNAPAVKATEQRLGIAWLTEAHVGAADVAPEGEDHTPTSDRERAMRKQVPSRYSSLETIHFMARIAVAAWPLLVLSATLIVASVCLHLYQLRIQGRVLNAASTGAYAEFAAAMRLLPPLALACVLLNWVSNFCLQLYLRVAMQKLYTALFRHVLFQDLSFYDGISTSELATRTGMDMMSIRILCGFLVQKVVKGVTQVTAGVVLLVATAGPLLVYPRFTLLLGTAIAVSVAELAGISLVIRNRHRVARSYLGRLFGFAYDVFSSLEGVMAMALQRSFTRTYASLAQAYFGAALDLAVWLASHESFLEIVFNAGVTVGVLWIGGGELLVGAMDVGMVYSLVRYIAVLEEGYVALSEAVARFFASYGSLEHVIDLHERGQLTKDGKQPVLMALEQDEAASSTGWLQSAEEGSAPPLRALRLTAARWVGGLRLRGVTYAYRSKPGNVLESIDLDLLPASLTVVSGATGAGRTTLAHIVHLDLTTINGGTIQFGCSAGSNSGSGDGSMTTWLPFHPTSSDRYELQQCMGFVSPGSAIDGVFFASVQENLVCACTQSTPSVAEYKEAAAAVGFDEDVARLPDGYQTLVGEASHVDLPATARLRLGIARLLLLRQPLLVVVDDADRFLASVPRFPEIMHQLCQAGAAVLLTVNSSSARWVAASLPVSAAQLVLENGCLRQLDH